MAITDLSDKMLHEQIDSDRREKSKNPADGDEGERAVKLYRDYAAGKQGCTLTEALASILEGATKHMFSDNKCHPVISEAADRIVLLRYDVDPPDAVNATDATQAAVRAAEEVKTFLHREIFVKCALSDLSGYTNYATFRDANFCLHPTWSEREQRVVIHKELWWDGESGVFVMYDEWGRAEYAVKEWTVTTPDKTKLQRRTVFLDAEIRRYARPNGAGDWEPFKLEEDNNIWPIPWQKTNGDPLHIPIVHFENGGRGEVASELSGGVIGNQDALNDKRYDMDAASRFTAYQMYWVKGKPELTANKQRVRPTVGPGIVWQLGEDGAAGVLAAGSMKELESAYNLIVRAISQITRTPMHVLLGADPPSGEALLRAELPAVNKAVRQREKLAPAYATLAHRCVEISNAFGATNLNEDALITPVFAPVTQLGELQAAMAESALYDAANKAVTAGVPIDIFLEDHGWSAEKLEKLKTLRQEAEQTAQDEEERTLERLMRAAEASGNSEEVAA